MENSDLDIAALTEENQNLKAMLKAKDELIINTTNMKQTVKTLRRNFQGMVQLLIETISLDNLFLGSHLHRSAEMSKGFCEFLKLPKDIIFLNYYATLLHDIGLVGTNSAIIEKRSEDLNEEDKNIFLAHPVLGAEIINSIYNLKKTAISVRSHHENYDGTGFPDKLAGGEIPKESRIIHIINDYDINKFKMTLSTEESCSKMEDARGSLYDPQLTNDFLSFISHFEKNNKGSSKTISSEELKPGMYLNQDIILSNGLLLIPSGIILDKGMIGKIQSFSSMLLGKGIIQVNY
jgi:response regulator RpfG family c-di-GMP phosphodiesterase